MARYIDFERVAAVYGNWEDVPTIEIVHCKDCKHYGKASCAFDTYEFEATEESYCSYGERENDE